MGFLTPENQLTHTLDPSKLGKHRRLEKIRAREEKEISSRPVRSIYFNGKKIATIVRHTGKNGKNFQKTEIQDHYVLIEEPQSVFLGHVVPFSGHGISLAVAIYRFLKTRKWDKDAIVFGCDGTNPNVGSLQGCLAYLEKLLGHAVHWEVCLLHGNELPLRALFRFHDGKTSGPASFTGPIGKELQELQEDHTRRKPVKFTRIKNDSFPQLPEEVVCDLSHNQQYLYDICWAIIEGKLDEDFALRQPGALCHSRWVTLANLILLLYALTAKPSKALKRMVLIIIQFYAPSYFWIKSHPHCSDGPKNLLKMVLFSRKLSVEEQQIAQKTIQRNGFYAHPESILRSMLIHDDLAIREKAVEKIQLIRQEAASRKKEKEESQDEEEDEEGVEEEVEEEEEEEEDGVEEVFSLDPLEKEAIENSTVRRFIVPKINFKAETYVDLIDWQNTQFTEPPLTVSFSEHDLSDLIRNPLSIPHFTCHTQAVERAIRIVTEAAGAVIGPEARDGYIRQKMKSRKEISRFDSKKDLFNNLEKP